MNPPFRQLAIACVVMCAMASVAAAAGDPAHASLNASDHAFLADAMTANQLDIDVSAYAAKYASAPKVRQFAQTMLAAHTRLAAEMQKVNDGLIPKPAPTAQPGINLLGRNGVELDIAYVGLIAAYEEDAAGKFAAAEDGMQHSAAIRSMARTLLPMIRHDEALAKAFDKSMK